MITIDSAKCQHCNRCHLICPSGLIDKGPVFNVSDREFCLECGHCVAICPEGAITLAGFETLETPLLAERPLIETQDFNAFLHGRRSGRLYRKQAVSGEHLEQMLEAASYGPSSENLRPVKVHVIADTDLIEQIRRRATVFYRRLLWIFNVPGFAWLWRTLGRKPEALEQLKHASRSLTNPEQRGRTDPLLHNARTLLAFSIPRAESQNVGDAWIAAWNAALCAETLGVSACLNGFVELAANWDGSLRSMLGVARGERVVNVLTLGYPSLRFARAAPRRQIETNWTGQPPLLERSRNNELKEFV